MLSLKWKIFRIVSYLHMTSAVIMGAWTIKMAIEVRASIRSTEDIIGISLIFLCPIILLTNSSINIHLLEKYYPDSLPGKKIRRLSNTFFVFASLVAILAIALSITGFYELSSRKYTDRKQIIIGYLVIANIGILGITGCIILWNQVSMRKAIRRNYEASLNSFLESAQT